MKDSLFFLVWRNIYIRKCIYQHVKLYKINQHKEFENRRELIEYPYRDYIQTLEYSNKVQRLFKGDIPNNGILEKVIIKSTSVIRTNDIIPTTVRIKEISFPIYTLDDDIDFMKIPTFLNSIINIGITNYNGLKKFYNNLVKLDIGVCSRFNLKLESNLLPVSLTFLNLGSEWNNDGVPLKIGDLSSLINLKVLKMSKYKQELRCGVLPINKSLIKLKVGEFPTITTTTTTTTTTTNILDQYSKNWVIPNTVKRLTITDPNRIPSNNNYMDQFYYEKILKGMIISSDEINSIIPNSVTKLKLLSKELVIKANSIPNSVTHLEIGNVFQKSSPIITKDILPNSLKTLIVTESSFKDHQFKIQHGDLLKLNNLTKFQVKPISLTNLSTFTHNWDEPIYKGFFPSTLTFIDLGPSFNYKINNDVLPCNLLDLRFGYYNHPLPKLPSSLTSLYFKGSFNQIIEAGSLPDSITYLNLGSSYKNPIDSNALPKSLKIFYPKELLNNNNNNKNTSVNKNNNDVILPW